MCDIVKILSIKFQVQVAFTTVLNLNHRHFYIISINSVNFIPSLCCTNLQVNFNENLFKLNKVEDNINYANSPFNLNPLLGLKREMKSAMRKM